MTLEIYNKKIEGYWYSEHSPEYPKPIPNRLTPDQARQIYVLIKAMQLHPSCSKQHYKGSSTSRITGEPLGSGEYETRTWKWPEDFAHHYVLEHRVKPTDDFLKYIGYYEK